MQVIEKFYLISQFCGSRIRFFPSWIQGCGQDPWSASNNLSIFNPKTDTKFSKIRSGMFIPWSCLWIFFHPGSGSRIQGSNKHRIPNPDPQHWYFYCYYIYCRVNAESAHIWPFLNKLYLMKIGRRTFAIIYVKLILTNPPSSSREQNVNDNWSRIYRATWHQCCGSASYWYRSGSGFLPQYGFGF